MQKKMMSLLLSLLMALVVAQAPVFAHEAHAAQAARSKTGTLTGTLRYASMKFWVETGKGKTVDVSYDMGGPLEDKLMELNGQRVTLTGKYTTNPDGSKFFQVESIGSKGSKSTSAAFTAVGKSVQLNGKTVFQDEDSLAVSIKKTYTLSGKSVALVEVDSGGTACPAEFMFVTAGSDGGASVTSKFGNCSDTPKISKKGEKLTLAFPGNPPETWMYSNGKIAKKK
jgi:hypothetical protein